MKNKLSTIFFTILIVLAAGWGIMWYIRKTVPPKMEFQTTEFSLIGNNSKLTINDLKGNVVIVSFFQTWCGSCIQEMYVFDEMVAKINPANLKILCISDEDEELIKVLQSRFTSGNILFINNIPIQLFNFG